LPRRTASRRFVLDGALLGEIDQLRDTLRLAKQAEKYASAGLADESPRLEQQLNELATKAAEEALLVVVEALPGEVFDDIARQHPPTAQQLDRWREQAKAFPFAEMPEWDDKTMAPALLEACLVEPKWSERWWREQSKGTQNQLWNLAIGVQVQGADLPFYNAATGTTNGGGVPSTIAVNGDSPSPNF
jgi:hypothetical protein